MHFATINICCSLLVRLCFSFAAPKKHVHVSVQAENRKIITRSTSR
jgi:hypothetical protein